MLKTEKLLEVHHLDENPLNNDVANLKVIESEVPLSRVMAIKELLRLERRIERQEATLRLLATHRERLLKLIGGGA